MKKNSDINEQLANGKILPLLLKLTIPVTVAQLVNALYSIVDRMYITRMPDIGTTALSGLGITFPIIMIITAFSSLIGNGGGPLSSIRLGAGDKKGAEELLGNAFSALILMGVALTAIFLVFKDPLLVAFGASPTNLPYATEYLNVYLLGTVFVQLSLGLNSFITAQGYSGVGMVTVIIGAVINVVLDPIFIFTLDMGIKGAAWATIIAQAASTIWAVAFLFSKKPTVRIKLENLKIKWVNLKATCALGVSVFTFQLNECIVTIVINLLLKWYGGADSDTYIASMAILSSLLQIFFMPLNGIVRGAQPIIGYNTGCKNFGRIKETVKYARVCSITCATLFWAAVMFLSRPVAMAFTPDPALIDMTVITMRLMFCTIFMLGMQMVNQNAFIAMGNTKLSFLFGILRKVILLIPLAFILPLFWGVWGVFVAEAFANFFAVIITYIVFTRFMNNLKARFERENAQAAAEVSKA